MRSVGFFIMPRHQPYRAPDAKRRAFYYAFRHNRTIGCHIVTVLHPPNS